MAHPVVSTMAALARWLRLETDLATFSGDIWDVPPDNLPRLPAIVILWDSENASEFDGQGDVPITRQYLDETFEVRILSDQPDAVRAQVQVLTAIDGVRKAVNAHQTLKDSSGISTCLQCRYESAKQEPVEYGDRGDIPGATVTLRCLIDVAGNFGG